MPPATSRTTCLQYYSIKLQFLEVVVSTCKSGVVFPSLNEASLTNGETEAIPTSFLMFTKYLVLRYLSISKFQYCGCCEQSNLLSDSIIIIDIIIPYSCCSFVAADNKRSEITGLGTVLILSFAVQITKLSVSSFGACIRQRI